MIILWLTGCISLDFAVFPAVEVDAYTLDFEHVPPELVEEVRFDAEGVELAGVWVRQEGGAPPMIFWHGYNDNLDAYTPRLDYYWQWGRWDVFAFDYRGYGTSDGTPDEAGVLEADGLAAVRYVSEVTGVPPEEIPWVTLSLGASAAAHTNDEIPAAGVVYESMYASADHVLDDSVGMDLPQGWFLAGSYDNVEAIRHVVSPVFVVHGTADDFIPATHAGEIYAAAPDNPKQLWQPDGVGHSDVITVMPDEYEARVIEFFDTVAP